MKSCVPVAVWGGLVWLAVGSLAFVMPMVVPLAPTRIIPAALGEVVLCAPLAAWLGLLAAQSLSAGHWRVVGRAVAVSAEPAAYWAFTGATIMIAAGFLAAFMRGVLSLVIFGI